MASDSEKQPSQIKHYKRANARAETKELITEDIKTGSATFAFLQKMEEKRLSRECMRTVDMRNQVDAPCTSFVFRGRTMWMDTQSYATFREELKKNQGIFTIGAYEKIINAPHTYHGQSLANGGAERQGPQSTFYQDWATGKSSTQISSSSSRYRDGAYNAFQSKMGVVETKDSISYEIIPLGYFKKRVDSRLRRSVEITLTAGATVRQAKTRDISVSGMLVRSTADFVPDKGSYLTVVFGPLESQAPAPSEPLSYRVIRSEVSGAECLIAMTLDPPQSNSTTQMLAQFIERQLNSGRRAQRLEMTDAILSATSLMAERYYIQSTSTLPFFLANDSDGGIRLQTLCVNSANLRLLKNFEIRPGKFDLRGLNISERLTRFVAMGEDEGRNAPLIAVSRNKDGKGIRVVADFEFAEHQDWLHFLGEHRDREHFAVLKVLLRSVQQPDPQRVLRAISRLEQKSPSEAEKIVRESHAFMAAGNLVDISEEIKHLPKHSLALPGNPQNKPPGSYPVQGIPQPELLGMGYVERQRREDRYQHALKVLVHIGANPIETNTRDISVHGLSLVLPSRDIPCRVDDAVSVSFPELQQPGSLLDVFRNRSISADYVVVGINPGAKPVVRMKVTPNEKSKRLAERINALLDAQKDHLNPDLSEVIRAAKSRYYAELVTESSATLPVFLFRDRETSQLQLRLGVPDVPSAVTTFFELSEDSMDFGPVGSSQRLNHWYAQLQKAPRVTSTLFMYKEQIPGEARFRIHSLADFESSDQQVRKQFIDTAYEQDYCFVKLILSRPHPPPAFEIDQIMEELKEYSHVHAGKLAQEFETLVAVGDIIDFSRQISETFM